MVTTGERCLTRLDELGVRYRRADKVVRKIATPIVLLDGHLGGIELRARYAERVPVMDCHLALAFATYGNVFALAGVSQIRYSSIYTMRRARLAGRERRILSRHALGLAIDIRAVVTTDGKVHTVKHHYRQPGSVLRKVEALLRATSGFRAVVTPGNESAHVDHFHLSAKMSIDGAAPDPTIEPSEVLSTVRDYHRTQPKRRIRRHAAVGGVP